MVNGFLKIKIIAKGDVIGVGFRAHCDRLAKRMNATGYARNLSDGTVEVEFEFEPSLAGEILRGIRLKGHVESLDIREISLESERVHEGFRTY
jgi:acylphosphatase